ncbi:LysM peptidoglycan-binding domain-containing protein [Terracoccus luteus]|uniref:LysM domain-containing protein n=1 Tax=Terracoccus luteus TaxID=53356 RepID=A0A839PU68_9MICO|nr:LysM peptidoglycan-binding domain-containing protein [Terracoccus luteus]MBB2987057.1 hypothetical protein [Terracoccus luteus]MCP2172708.1 hypothetical protein [Terracoccus luteus]
MGATVLSFADPSPVAPARAVGTAHPSVDPTHPAYGRPGRPRLVSLPTGADALGRVRRAQPVLRITRLGRLVLVTGTLAVVIALSVGLAGQLASAGGESRSVTVRSGETLSQIAARELPDLAVRDGVVALQLQNSLASDQVSAGQQLLVPTP